MDPSAATIEIRRAGDADSAALRRLAERDSAALPDAGSMVALRGGGILAARADDGRVLADPFAPTADLVALLEAHVRGSAGPRAAAPAVPRLGLAR